MTNKETARRTERGEFLSDLIKKGVVIRLDKDTTQELFMHRLRQQAAVGYGVPVPELAALARHCIRKWISTYPNPKSNDDQQVSELSTAEREHLSELLENGVTVRLDENTLRELFLYRVRLVEEHGQDLPIPGLPALARHCVRKWISAYPTPQNIGDDHNE